MNIKFHKIMLICVILSLVITYPILFIAVLGVK